MTTRSHHDASGGVAGLSYGFGVTGKWRFRIRDRHIANHLISLINKRAGGAAKLDLLLRAIALLPDDLGDRKEPPGFVLPSISWEALHDLARGDAPQGQEPAYMDSASDVRKLKRKWVDENLKKLEAMALVKRDAKGREGRRPKLYVLRDDGTGRPFDDPTGREEPYTTILGGIFSSRAITGWDGRTLAAYLAAMYAEHHTRGGLETDAEAGAKRWFRSPTWFADPKGTYGPDARVKLPISPPSLIYGLRALEDEQLITHRHVTLNPVNGQRLQGPRNLYTNRFADLAKASQEIAPAVREEAIARALVENDDQ